MGKRWTDKEEAEELENGSENGSGFKRGLGG